MSRCLDDAALLELRNGDAPADAREHLASCVPCTRRAATLARDLAVLERVLRDAAIPALPRPTISRGVVAAAAATVLLVLVTLAAIAPGRPTVAAVEQPAARVRAAADERRLRDLSRALFALDPLDPVVRLRRTDELSYVRAALGGVAPCERDAAGCTW